MINIEKLKEIYQEYGRIIESFLDFRDIYNYATDENFSFLWIDI
tara:strand:+ start:309 stop:440 length:132 start_codon:yes stop_codon:yes gene_type:complete